METSAAAASAALAAVSPGGAASRSATSSESGPAVGRATSLRASWTSITLRRYPTADGAKRAHPARKRRGGTIGEAGEPGFEPGFTVLETVRIAVNSLPRSGTGNASRAPPRGVDGGRPAMRAEG